MYEYCPTAHSRGFLSCKKAHVAQIDQSEHEFTKIEYQYNLSNVQNQILMLDLLALISEVKIYICFQYTITEVDIESIFIGLKPVR